MPEETEQNVVMVAKDTLFAALAKCYVTIGDRRYNFMQANDIEAKFTKKKKKVPTLGKTGSGNKAVGWEGTGTAKFYYNTSIFRKMMLDYKNTGQDIYFDMQIINNDPESAAGRQEIILIDCNIDGGVLAKLGTGDDILEEDMDFTFDDFSMPEEFKELAGFSMTE